jgi:5-methyltetrahydropteroyltriglutamate--homocysteine methyltransferase
MRMAVDGTASAASAGGLRSWRRYNPRFGTRLGAAVETFMSRRTTPPFRADHVGSFLRPAALLEARERFREGTIPREALRAAEDSAIADIVRFQEELGLDGITDGEFRRTYFHVDFLEQLEGVEAKGGIQVSFRSSSGSVDFSPPVMQVTGKVRHVRDIQLADFRFLRSRTSRTPKVTIPSPTMLHFRGGRGAISQQAYPDLEAFYADVAAAYRAELKSLADAGCRYVQLDDTNLAYLCDEKMREGARRRGDDPDELPRRYARLINAAIADRPAGMTVCVHLCRGNFKSAWAAEGGYEPVAQVLFQELDVDGYFLEYDDARSGDFAPLRFLPRNKIVVLGLVTTKLGALESRDDIKRRIEEAARHAPLEQLCLSPQCGFSSTVHGNEIAREAQAAKLRLVVETAREVWGE